MPNIKVTIETGNEVYTEYVVDADQLERLGHSSNAYGVACWLEHTTSPLVNIGELDEDEIKNGPKDWTILS